ncbi:MAG: hypothetical protein JOY63_10180 [Acetobacteraceae bacterium]|nr:hypothetical protein [Acetobacteraceae bacterium]
MVDRTTLARLARLVAAEAAAGQPGPNSLAASRSLEARPEAALDVLDMLLAEWRRKRRNEALVAAYGYMLGQALEYARYGVEGGVAQAAESVEAVRQRLLAAGRDGQIEPALLLMILREFATAKLDPGPELRALMDRLTEGMAASAPDNGDAGASLAMLDGYIEELAREVGGDPFELHAQVQEMASAFPEEQRAAFGAWLLASHEPVAREAALGWLLDASAPVRNSMASGIERAAARGGVSGVTLRRLIALRNWLPEADRVSVDRAVQACRRGALSQDRPFGDGVGVSPWPQAQVREVLASVLDGAGAQSLFMLTREGRRNACACLLLKQGIGVRDAWARHGLSRAELGEFLEQVQEIELLPTSLDYARIATAHALAVNLGSGVMPPFALLDVLETAGLQGIQPATLTADAVLALLDADADPALSQPEVIAEVLASSRDLPDELAYLDSWFEADSEVERLLGAKGMTRARRLALARDEILPRRAAKWLEKLAWTALTLRHGDEDEPWEAFYVSARELRAGRPIAGIPLMMHVAAPTVDACAAAHRRSP